MTGLFLSKFSFKLIEFKADRLVSFARHDKGNRKRNINNKQDDPDRKKYFIEHDCQNRCYQNDKQRIKTKQPQ